MFKKNCKNPSIILLIFSSQFLSARWVQSQTVQDQSYDQLEHQQVTTADGPMSRCQCQSETDVNERHVATTELPVTAQPPQEKRHSCRVGQCKTKQETEIPSLRRLCSKTRRLIGQHRRTVRLPAHTHRSLFLSLLSSSSITASRRLSRSPRSPFCSLMRL